MKRPIAVSATVALLLGAALAPTAAHAASGPETLAQGLLSPLSLALDVNGDLYVTDNFAGTLSKVKNGAATPLYTTATPGNEVGAVSALAGTVYFAETTADGALLKKIDRRGTVSQIADLGAYEKSKNPDGAQRYGFTSIPDDCAAQLPPFVQPSYTGEVYSHPYATIGTPIGTVVADAGGNALNVVGPKGNVKTLAVFPVQKLVLPEGIVELGFPACAVGLEYAFEPVPTDVELGPDGWLYVSLLPGGPESPALGARGSVVKVNLFSGKTVTVASGLLSATNIAVSPRGDIYVAELFGGRISLVKKGSSTAVPFREAALPGAVEWGLKGLYATVDSVPPFSEDPDAPPPAPAGKVVRFGW